MKSQAELERWRAVSKVAFGQTHRLELMLAILDIEDGVCSLSELAARLGVPISSLQRPFDALSALELIRPIPDGETRTRFHMRTQSPAWDWARTLRAQSGDWEVLPLGWNAD